MLRRIVPALALGVIAPALTVAPAAQAAPVPESAQTAPTAMAAAAPADGLDPELTLTDLASRGQGEWLRYRIPALTTAANGDLIAVFDGRPTMNDLPSNIALLQRRSTDGGNTWGPTEVIRREPAPNGFGDPSLIVDRDTGDIFAFYAASINAGFASSTTSSDPNDPNVLHPDYSVSRDNGNTWEHHRITRELKAGHTDWAGMFAASGEGIQLRTGPHAGRLLQQYTVRASGGNYAFTAYSDDHGATWKAGAPVGPGADENKVVELSDGRVMLISRAAPRRLVAISEDGGQTYSAFTPNNELTDPANNGSVIRAFPDAPPDDPRAKILLHSNTDNQYVRRNLTVKMSCDNGQTWPVEKVVQSGASAYSTLTPLPAADGTLGGSYGLFYEREGYRHISYTSFDLSWVDGVCAAVQVSAPQPLAPGVAGSVQVTLTNQSGAGLPAGRVGLPAGATWSSPGADVPALAAGASETVTLPLTAPRSTFPSKHEVRVEYRADGGVAGTDAQIDVQGAYDPVPKLELRPVLDAIYTGGDPGVIGDVIRPWLEVHNTGSVALNNISVTSPEGSAGCNFSSLAPGASYVCRNQGPSHTVTSADLAAGFWAPIFRATAVADGVAIESSAPLFPVDLTESSNLQGPAEVSVPGGELATSAMVRVPRVGDPGVATAQAVTNLRVPAHGRASAQLVVTAESGLTGLTANVGTLRTASGQTMANAVRVRWPEYITNEVEGGVVADPLREVAALDVAAGVNQPIWLTVEVPGGTAPGNYSGTIQIASADGAIESVPLQIEVPQVKLRPVSDRPFVLDLWSHPDAVADYLDLEPWSEAHFAALKPYWADLAGAGQDVVNVAVVEDPWLVNHNGEIRAQTASPYRSTVEWRWDGERFTFDFSVFDRIVADSRAAGIDKNIHAFAMLQFQGHDRISYVDTRTGELTHESVAVGDPRYIEAWRAFLTAFTAHLSEKGWLEDTRLAFDEQPIARMQAAFDVIESVDPAWLDRIALAANSLAEADIAEAISFNVSFLDDVPQSLIDERRAAGKPTLFYTWNEPRVPNTVVPTPPFNTRTLGWVVEQRDLDGFLRWTYNSWPEDITKDPTFRYGQGDEYILYPGSNGPVSSTRWELFRDGLDDAEILNLAKERLGPDNPVLTEALAAVDADGAANDAARQGLADQRNRLLTALSQADGGAGAALTATVRNGAVAAGGIATLDVTATAGSNDLKKLAIEVPKATHIDGIRGNKPLKAGASRTWTVQVPVAEGEDTFFAHIRLTADGQPVDSVTVRAPIVAAIAPTSAIVVDRLSTGDQPIIASVSVRNVSAEPAEITLAASGAATFAADPTTVTVPSGGLEVVELSLDPQGRSGHDYLEVTLSAGAQALASERFDLIAGGTFISDLPIDASTNGWGPIELDRSNGEDAAGDGAPLTLNGRVYAKGIGAHAASTVSLTLPAGCTSLSFDYGVDDEMGAGGSLAFEVKGDGASLWRSATMNGNSATGSETVGVAGVSKLDLVLDPLGAVGQDHGDWANIWVACG